MRFERRFRGEAFSEANEAGLHFSRLEQDKVYRKIAALNRLVDKLLFGSGHDEWYKMAAVPQGAFAVLQVRKNFERSYTSKYQEGEEENKRDNKNSGFNAKVLQEGRELTPLKYNSKLMNSIWGLYNRYSVHNFKKIDANETSLLVEAWGALTTPAAAAEPHIVGEINNCTNYIVILRAYQYGKSCGCGCRGRPRSYLEFLHFDKNRRQHCI